MYGEPRTSGTRIEPPPYASLSNLRSTEKGVKPSTVCALRFAPLQDVRCTLEVKNTDTCADRVRLASRWRGPEVRTVMLSATFGPTPTVSPRWYDTWRDATP
jgi:hypothetical protein